MTFEPIWDGTSASAEAIKIDAHPTFSRILSKLPQRTRSSFTPLQLSALSEATRPPPANHKIDYRVSLSFLGRRYYLTLLIGRERRNLERLRAEGQLGLRRASIIYFLATWLGLSILFMALFAYLYFVKSLFGVDVFKGPSLLHGIVF